MINEISTTTEIPPEMDADYLPWKLIKLQDAIYSLRNIYPEIANKLSKECEQIKHDIETAEELIIVKRDYRDTVYKILCERDGEKCQGCGREDGLTIDHIKPIALGGTNDIDNLQLLCQSCNSSKGMKWQKKRG